jgi:hypothetical protein
VRALMTPEHTAPLALEMRPAARVPMMPVLVPEPPGEMVSHASSRMAATTLTGWSKTLADIDAEGLTGADYGDEG